MTPSTKSTTRLTSADAREQEVNPTHPLLRRSPSGSSLELDLSFWVRPEEVSAEVRGTVCDPADRYAELRDRATLVITVGTACTVTLRPTRAEWTALAELALTMAQSIPERAP